MGKPLVIFLLTFYALVSCTKDDNMTGSSISTNPVIADTTQVAGTSGNLAYLALGDSYTIGQSVAVSDRFPVQAASNLNSQGIHFSDPEIIAQTGWTTQNLLDKLAVQPPARQQYDIVTLLIGVNNQYQHRTQQEYSDQFLTLLNKAIQYAGNNKKRVVVLSIPDYSVTPFASGSDRALIARQIDSFNIINKIISTQLDVNYLNITEFSRAAANDPSLVAADGLHPSGSEYKVWADALLPVIKEALQ